MPGTFTQLYTHAVFSTKNRENCLNDERANKIYKYIQGILKNKNGHLLSIGGTRDHIHILLSVPPKVSISEILKEIKGSSSIWINRNFPELKGFKWQTGFGAFSVSQSQLETVRDYIENQKEHHKKYSFKDEFRMMLKRHNISFDEQYIWT